MAAGHTIEFAIWTESDLTRKMATAEVGLRTYWFGGFELSGPWLSAKLNLATAALGERYHPHDHVEVKAESLLDALVRHPRAKQELTLAFQAVREAPPYVHIQDAGRSVFP